LATASFYRERRRESEGDRVVFDRKRVAVVDDGIITERIEWITRCDSKSIRSDRSNHSDQSPSDLPVSRFRLPLKGSPAITTTADR